jgi:tRNA U54 and U55 pseudouridine synthase Pus10
VVENPLLEIPKKCPICRQKFSEHSELQDKICKIITIKEFAAYCPGFDVQYRPTFDLSE